jgi:hypothetical protein
MLCCVIGKSVPDVLKDCSAFAIPRPTYSMIQHNIPKKYESSAL